MIKIANATLDDLTYIASWLCQADRLELSVTRDVNNYEQLAADAYSSAIRMVALEDRMLPVFAFGAYPIGDDTVRVWGFKTPRGPHAIHSVTKYLLRVLIPSLRSIGISRAVCAVHQNNHGSRRWLAHLGFRPGATPGETGTPLILYQRDEPVSH